MKVRKELGEKGEEDLEGQTENMHQACKDGKRILQIGHILFCNIITTNFTFLRFLKLKWQNRVLYGVV